MKQLALFVFLLAVNNTIAQDFNKLKMDSLFMRIETKNQGMGTISIFKDDKEVYSRSIGYSSLEKNLKSNKNTVYRIGSISKTFTAVLTLQLIEKGKLSLDTKIDKYFPQLQNADKISIEMLLRHRSGIFSFTSDKEYTSYMEKPMTHEELMKKISGFDSVFEPDTQMQYSNSNYVVLAYILEKIEGQPFSDLLQSNICKPCSLKQTNYGGKIDTQNNEAQSYIYHNKWKSTTESDMSIPSGAGAIVSTAPELNSFLNCLFSGQLISESSLEKMKTLQDRYGLGMFKYQFDTKSLYGHNGGIDGFKSNAFYIPEENASITYLSNGVLWSIDEIFLAILSIYFNKDYDLPVFMSVDKAVIKKYLGTYSTPTFPLKILISERDNKLYGQATGQSPFPLEPYDEHKFKFDMAKIKMEFVPKEDKMIFQQGAKQIEFTKE